MFLSKLSLIFLNLKPWALVFVLNRYKWCSHISHYRSITVRVKKTPRNRKPLTLKGILAGVTGWAAFGG